MTDQDVSRNHATAINEGVGSIEDFIDFIAASPSSYQAADQVRTRLETCGFQHISEQSAWPTAAGNYVVQRGGAVIAVCIPPGFGTSTDAGFRIIGSHTDSPGFMVKPHPQTGSAGWAQLAVEVYGGPIIHSWFDRELTIAGQVVLKDGSCHLINTGAIARIPNLAIHLSREATFEADRQIHTQPVLGLLAEQINIQEIFASHLNAEAGDIAAFNLITADAQRGEIFGAENTFLAAGRMDNLSSVWATVTAFSKIAANYTGKDALVLAAFDHEEVGSSSRYGAAGPFLEDALVRTATAWGADEEERRRLFALSTCVSADAAHSVHPNYAGKHDPGHLPLIGQGPVTKINANQRYASDALSVARWESACASVQVPVQQFVGNNSVPCGTTIGPLTATRLGIDTVDVGVPMLSMHSAREMIGVRDELWLAAALQAYLTN